MTPRQFAWGLAAVSLAGWLLRASPLAGDGGAWAVRVDYDEGVYFAAASLLLKGVLPYRDFVFVHPPAFLLALAPAAALAGKLSLPGAFSLARWLATFVGAGNVVLCGLLGRRVSGTLGGLVAATLYAVYPEAVAVERGVFLEPALNMACLGAALLAVREEAKPPVSIGAGFLAGLAIAIKLWGGIWFLACAAAVVARGRRSIGLFALGAGIALAIFLGSLAMSAPAEFWRDAIAFQLHRPADHLPDRLARLAEIFSHRHAATWLLGLIGLGRTLWRARQATPRERLVLVAYVLTLAAFVSASSFWSQYDAFLAPAEVLMASIGIAWLWDLARGAGPLAQLAVGLLIAAGIALGAVKTSRVNEHARGDELAKAGLAVRHFVSPEDCLFALEPGWGIAAGRLPGTPRPWVDPYARMLLEAETASHHADVAQAFADSHSQNEVRQTLDTCRFALLGDRARWQLSSETWSWINAHFTRVCGCEPDLWQRSP